MLTVISLVEIRKQQGRKRPEIRSKGGKDRERDRAIKRE